jgi:hypothetical protein
MCVLLWSNGRPGEIHGMSSASYKVKHQACGRSGPWELCCCAYNLGLLLKQRSLPGHVRGDTGMTDIRFMCSSQLLRSFGLSMID